MDLITKLKEIKKKAGKARSRYSLAKINRERRKAKVYGNRNNTNRKRSKKVPKKRTPPDQGSPDGGQ